MSIHDFLILAFLFQLKHFVCDFLLQGPYMFMNKGTYGHPGGILHSAVQVLGTVVILALFGVTFWPTLLLSLLEGVIHYHIDWVKMNINTRFGLNPNKSQFWYLLGADQLLHQATYLILIGSVSLI